MKSLFLSFGLSGPKFDFTKVVVNFRATVQNALVNLGTDLGSDPVFLNRGTYLKKDGAEGKMATKAWANHFSNFAALRTRVFLQQTDLERNRHPLQALFLKCRTLEGSKAVLDVQALSSTGETIGSTEVL